jgi:hypothetical protein
VFSRSQSWALERSGNAVTRSTSYAPLFRIL